MFVHTAAARLDQSSNKSRDKLPTRIPQIVNAITENIKTTVLVTATKSPFSAPVCRVNSPWRSGINMMGSISSLVSVSSSRQRGQSSSLGSYLETWYRESRIS